MQKIKKDFVETALLIVVGHYAIQIQYRRDIYESLNRTSSRIAASGLAQEFRIVLPAKVKIKNSTSSVHAVQYRLRKYHIQSTS